MRARVTVAYATVKILDATGKWTVHGFHQGAIFPDSADAASVAALVRRGYAEWVDEVPDEEPAGPQPNEELVHGPAGVENPEAAEPAMELPAQSAPKADWVAYAVYRGAEQGDAEARTKADLIAEYGG